MINLVYACNSDNAWLPMTLNDDLTLGFTNFSYSAPYSVSGFCYIEESYLCTNGTINVRVLCVIDYESGAPHQLSAHNSYYKLAEVIPYQPDNIFPCATHFTVKEDTWILQNWLIAYNKAVELSIYQWNHVQTMLQQQYFTEVAAYNAYIASLEAAQAKQALYKANKKIANLQKQVQNKALKFTAAATKKTKQAEEGKQKLNKSQRKALQQNKILLAISVLNACSGMPSHTLPRVYNALIGLQLNIEDQKLFISNLNLPIAVCCDWLKKLHDRRDICNKITEALLHKIAYCNDSDFCEHAKNNHTQNLTTIAHKVSSDSKLQSAIKQKHLAWQKVKDLRAQQLTAIKANPQKKLETAIHKLDSNKYLQLLQQYPTLAGNVENLMVQILPALSQNTYAAVKDFICSIKLTARFVDQLHAAPTTPEFVRLATLSLYCNLSPESFFSKNSNMNLLACYQQNATSSNITDVQLLAKLQACTTAAENWAQRRCKSIMKQISAINSDSESKLLKIDKPLLAILSTMINDLGQTLLMIAIMHRYQKATFLSILEYNPPALLGYDKHGNTILNYLVSPNYKIDHDLIPLVRNKLVVEAKKAQINLRDFINSRNKMNGSTYLHEMLSGDDQGYAYRVLSELFSKDGIEMNDLNYFYETALIKENQGHNISLWLDYKNIEWHKVRKMLYDNVATLITSSDCFANYQPFFISSEVTSRLFHLAVNDHARFLDILDARTLMQLKVYTACQAELYNLKLSQTGVPHRYRERISQFQHIYAFINFDKHEQIIIKNSGENIHGWLADQLVMSKKPHHLIQRYNDSLFYKNYSTIAINDTLVWKQACHKVQNQEVPNLQNPSKEITTLVTYLKQYPSQLKAAFLNILNTRQNFFILSHLVTNAILRTQAIAEFYRQKKHREFHCAVKLLTEVLCDDWLYNFSLCLFNECCPKQQDSEQMQQILLKGDNNEYCYDLGLVESILAYRMDQEIDNALEEVFLQGNNRAYFMLQVILEGRNTLLVHILTQRNRILVLNIMKQLGCIVVKYNRRGLVADCMMHIDFPRAMLGLGWDIKKDFVVMLSIEAQNKKCLWLMQELLNIKPIIDLENIKGIRDIAANQDADPESLSVLAAAEKYYQAQQAMETAEPTSITPHAQDHILDDVKIKHEKTKVALKL